MTPKQTFNNKELRAYGQFCTDLERYRIIEIIHKLKHFGLDEVDYVYVKKLIKEIRKKKLII